MASRRWRSIIWSSAAIEEVALCAEIMAESRRNPAVARIYQDMEADVRARFIALLQRAIERGEVCRDLDLDGAVTVLFALADGLSWRRAVEPAFNTESRDAARPAHGRATAQSA